MHVNHPYAWVSLIYKKPCMAKTWRDWHKDANLRRKKEWELIFFRQSNPFANCLFWRLQLFILPIRARGTLRVQQYRGWGVVQEWRKYRIYIYAKEVMRHIVLVHCHSLHTHSCQPRYVNDSEASFTSSRWRGTRRRRTPAVHLFASCFLYITSPSTYYARVIITWQVVSIIMTHRLIQNIRIKLF